MNKSKDLWPELLLEDVATPVSILAEQAKLLAGKTGNVIKAVVKTESRVGDKDDQEEFQHSFNLIAPALDNFKHRLFQVTHSIQPFPATLTTRKAVVEVENEKVLYAHLEKIFSDPETLNAIRILYAQSKVKEDKPVK